MRRFSEKRERNMVLEGALGYLAEGLSVIPIEASSKRPVVEWTEFQSRRATEEEVREWFKEKGRNVAIVCGKISGNLVIVDFDDEKLYKNRWQKKGLTRTSWSGRGVHLWFKSAVPTKTTRLKKSFGIPLDIQGEGAYVLAPPSYHFGTKQYYAFNEERTEFFPSEPIREAEEDVTAMVFEWLEGLPEYKKMPLSDAIDKIDIDKVLESSDEGSRNDDAIRLASWYRVGELSEEETMLKMRIWNKDKVRPPLTEKEIDVIVKQAFKNERPYFQYSFSRLPTDREKEPVQELTPEIEAFLRNPNMVDEIRETIRRFIIGEESLTMLLLMLGLCASFIERPFGCIIGATYGSGKSFTQEGVAKLFPKERVDQPTSVSEKVVNYLEGNFRGRIVRIDELFGTEEGMPYIRVWMTNGRLEHWVTDSDTGKAKKLKVEGSPVFWTSTVTNIEEQYGSRNWLCTTDVKDEQTRKIHKYQDAQDMMPKDFNEEDEKRANFLTDTLRWLMQNAKPVLVPFRVEFPYSDPRTRRDKPKFKDVIRAFAQLRQLQRETIEWKGKSHILADEQDFEDALETVMPFFVSTILTLDESALAILKWAKKNAPIGTYFSVKDAATGARIQKKTVYRRLEDMAERGYVTEISQGAGTRPNTYELTELGSRDTLIEIKIIDDYTRKTVRELLRRISEGDSEKKLHKIFEDIVAEEVVEESSLDQQDKNLEAQLKDEIKRNKAKIRVSQDQREQSRLR